MFQLYSKEINNFLNSLIGYIIISIFLLSIGLFLWIFKGTGFNIMENGYASIDPLFILTPWVYMFLVPAITMRMFAEERKSGTMELLLTMPLTELKIVLAKFLAGSTLVFISLVPTLIYYVSVYQLGSTVGNIDSGSTLGSYIGLLLLGMVLVAIGVFASSITENQVVAFIVALFLSFFMYAGFDSLSAFFNFEGPGKVFYLLGINSHYISISRGVMDSRDLVYFFSVMAFFIMLCTMILESRKW